MSWPMVKLGECCTVVGGATPKREVPEYWNSPDVPWVTPKDISKLASPVLDDAPEYISKLGLKNCSASIIPKGSILLTSRAPIGNVAIAGRDMCTNQGFKSLVPGSTVDGLYLYYCMLAYSEKLQALGNGATFKEVSKKVVEEFEIPLPPLAEQKRIAAILDKADAIRRKRQQAIQLADDFLRAVFLEMFGDPVTNPKGWEVKKLGDILRIRRGASPRPIKDYLGGTIPWIKIGDGSTGDQIYLHDTKEYVTEAGAEKSLYLDEGALIFANCGVSLGFARILKKAGCVHDGWLAFDEINQNFNKIFLLKWLNQLTSHFRTIAPEGTQPNLNTGIMKQQDLICPPIELQERFERIVYLTDSTLNKLKAAELKDAQQFSSISQKAFSGQL